MRSTSRSRGAHEGEGGEFRSDVSVSAVRFWQGARLDGTFITAKYSDATWNDPNAHERMTAEHRRGHGWFTGPLPYMQKRPSEGEIVMDLVYDDATWATLEEINKRMVELGARLRGLFRQPESLALPLGPQVQQIEVIP